LATAEPKTQRKNQKKSTRTPQEREKSYIQYEVSSFYQTARRPFLEEEEDQWKTNDR
jgi:hypothetical protein